MLYRQEPAIGFTVLNVLFIFSVIGYFFCGCHKTAGLLVNRVVMLAALNWLVNFLFIVVSSPALLRYDLSTMIINMAFIPPLLQRIYQTFRVGAAMQAYKHMA